ncbi:SDR family NAD(P)-dependent oxidoreductase [Massilibacteroides vaginae]|uniref:SDR family NAD(P)-dependent oxidoreductase n=1 Tax=Massilibacteroides vaginae TaxID=1673718 RepID=UPI001594C4F8
MKKGDNPAIINIASIAGLEGSRDGAAYHSSKAAVISLTECAALEFADFGIRVNSISPGAVLTDMVLNNEEYRDAINKMIEAVPLKKIANSEDIAKAISFLASSYAPVITGTNLIIDGGSTKV